MGKLSAVPSRFHEVPRFVLYVPHRGLAARQPHPHSHGWLDGDARSQNLWPKDFFYCGPGGHLTPQMHGLSTPLDRALRAAHGVFTFPILIQISII